MIKNTIPLYFFILLSFASFGQYCTGNNRFTQIPFFANADIQIDSAVYARATNWQGALQNLKLTVFQPKATVDKLKKRPMVMMIFGGGFIAGDRKQMYGHCMLLAQRGFVAVSIDYRLGKETVLPCNDTLSHEKAVYRAVQDGKAAMRYMVANAKIFKIDTAWLFAGGCSAGAGIANAMVYNAPEELQAVYPSIVSELGHINTSGNALTNTFKIKAIFNNWGGVSSDFFDADEAVPMVAFHGGNDGVVPVDSAVDVTCQTTDHYIYGSHALYSKLSRVGICTDLTVDLKGGHGVFQNGAGMLMRVNRATCFFKSLFCNSCTNYIATRATTPNCAQTVLEQTDEADQSDKAFTLFPNPSSATLYISPKYNTSYELILVNPLGMVVLKATDPQHIDVTHLPKGIYFAHIKQADQSYITKIIKEEE